MGLNLLRQAEFEVHVSISCLDKCSNHHNAKKAAVAPLPPWSWFCISCGVWDDPSPRWMKNHMDLIWPPESSDTQNICHFPPGCP